MKKIEYTESLGGRICSHLVRGKSLTSFCKGKGAPSVDVVYGWLATIPEFQHLYALAKKDQADSFNDRILAVIDNRSRYINEKGETDNAAVNLARLEVDSLKWMAAKQAPKKYGDKLQVGGAPDLPPLGEVNLLETSRKLMFVLKAAEREANKTADPALLRLAAPEVPAESPAMPSPLDNLGPTTLPAGFYAPRSDTPYVEEIEPPTDVVDIGGGFMRISDDESNWMSAEEAGRAPLQHSVNRWRRE